jgi:predicted flap endonuclease-1-like 5' DNA nuclease
MEFVELYWPVFLVALVIGAIAGYLIFRPKQRITLTDDRPVRPHMAVAAEPAHEGRGVADGAAAAASDVAGQMMGTQVHDELPGALGTPDDLSKLKGVGPKFAALLNERGIIRFDQIASLSPGQVETIDAALGAFRGRFARDRIVEQADYLARGDLDGYQERFGKL